VALAQPSRRAPYRFFTGTDHPGSFPRGSLAKWHRENVPPNPPETRTFASQANVQRLPADFTKAGRHPAKEIFFGGILWDSETPGGSIHRREHN
jgi:hypothetical protein